MNNELNNINFYCPIEECDSSIPPKDAPTFPRALGMKYVKALKHLKECLEKPRNCQLGCPEQVKLKDQEEHNQKCTKHSVPCEKCKQVNYINDAEYTHDCIKEMKYALQLEDIKLSDLKDSLGINYSRMSTNCPQGHQLKVHEGKVYSKITAKNKPSGTVQCNECEYSHLEMHDRFYRCQECDYDLCKMCTA